MRLEDDSSVFWSAIGTPISDRCCVFEVSPVKDKIVSSRMESEGYGMRVRRTRVVIESR